MKRFAIWGWVCSSCSVPSEQTAPPSPSAPETSARAAAIGDVLQASDWSTERWRNTSRGPAVDWRVPGSGARIVMPTRAEVDIRDHGRWARLTEESGRAWTFGPLLAWDREGRDVSVRFEADGPSLAVVVGEGAGPIQVDPVLRSAAFSAAFSADAVAGVGDLDGDGFDDIAAGALGGTTTTPGQVLVWGGGAGGPDASTPVDPTPSSAGWQYGRSVAGDGDLDGDGYADLVVGGDHRAWVHYGAATGVGGRTVRLDDPNGRIGEFGFAVNVAPDVNGDGVDDLFVGDPGYDSNLGLVALYLGETGAGVSTTPSQQLPGNAPGEWFGVDLAGVGDLDGDGLADLVVGAHAWNGITGRAYAYLGTTSGVSASVHATLAGIDPLDNFGRAVDGAGDVDQDGYADVVVGAFNGASAFGQAAVFHGSASGLATTATTIVQGPAYGAKFGNTVAGLGDVDGDGYPDVGMGGHGTTTQAGVHHGGPAGVSTAAVPALTGGVTFGKLLDGAGDVDGDGFAELLVADPGAGTVELYYGGPDLDGDGWISPEDCDDTDTGVRAGLTVWTDADGDGFGDPATEQVSCAPNSSQVLQAGDCDDADAAVHPDALERAADRVDSNCDGWELCYIDADGDGHLAELAETVAVEVALGGLSCADHGYADNDAPFGDCADDDATVFPGASELCNDRDEDCDGAVDFPVPDDAPLWWPDADGDGFGAGTSVAACAAPDAHVAATGEEDCDDTRVDVYPGARDVPGDGLDADCDGSDPDPETSDDPPLDSGTPVARDVSGKADGGCSSTGRLPTGLAGWGVVGLVLLRRRLRSGARAT
jgi:hypothetical protein